MRAVLIINPVSGDDEPNSEKVATVQTWLAAAPFKPEVSYTTEERGAGIIARDAVASGVEVIVVGGGDGTVSEVARELVHQPATLGILPIGTFNNIARSIGVLADLPVATAIIAAGHVREIDVGIANDTHYFFEAAGAGLDAALFPVGEEIKSGRWTHILQAARLAFRYQPQPFAITFERPLKEVLPPTSQRRMSARVLSGNTIRRNALLVVVANGPYYGSGFTVAEGARMRDGRLTVSVFRRFSKWELFRHFQSIAHGRRRYSPKIESFTGKEIQLTSPNSVATHIDGQPFGTTPLKLRALPGALRVFAPPDAGGQDVPKTADAGEPGALVVSRS